MTTSEPGEPRIKELEATLTEVLTHIRPQGHRSWALNTCLVTNEQVIRWAKSSDSPHGGKSPRTRPRQRAGNKTSI